MATLSDLKELKAALDAGLVSQADYDDAKCDYLRAKKETVEFQRRERRAKEEEFEAKKEFQQKKYDAELRAFALDSIVKHGGDLLSEEQKVDLVRDYVKMTGLDRVPADNDGRTDSRLPLLRPPTPPTPSENCNEGVADVVGDPLPLTQELDPLQVLLSPRTPNPAPVLAPAPVPPAAGPRLLSSKSSGSAKKQLKLTPQSRKRSSRKSRTPIKLQDGAEAETPRMHKAAKKKKKVDSAKWSEIKDGESIKKMTIKQFTTYLKGKRVQAMTEAWLITMMPLINIRQGELVIEEAAKRGYLRFFQVLGKSGCQAQAEPSTSTMETAIKGGHFEVVKCLRLRDRPCPWTSWCLAHAAAGGHLEMVKFMRSQEDPCKWDKWTAANAAFKGHLPTLQWLVANGCPWKDSCVFHNAAEGGQLETLKWLLEVGAPWDVYTPYWAAIKGEVDCLKWLVDQGCPYDPSLGGKEAFQKLGLVEGGASASKDAGADSRDKGGDGGPCPVIVID